MLPVLLRKTVQLRVSNDDGTSYKCDVPLDEEEWSSHMVDKADDDSDREFKEAEERWKKYDNNIIRQKRKGRLNRRMSPVVAR